MHLLDVCATIVRCLLDRVNGVLLMSGRQRFRTVFSNRPAVSMGSTWWWLFSTGAVRHRRWWTDWRAELVMHKTQVLPAAETRLAIGQALNCSRWLFSIRTVCLYNWRCIIAVFLGKMVMWSVVAWLNSHCPPGWLCWMVR